MRKSSSDFTPLATYVTRASRAIGLSLSEVASTLGVASSQLSRYLTGHIRMPLRRAAHLAHLLRLTEVQSDSLLVLIELSSSSPKLRAFVAELEHRAGRGERRDQGMKKAEAYPRYQHTGGEDPGHTQNPPPDAAVQSGSPTPPQAD
jgi:transcriptional regulator with XRE-family HTH domain